MTSCYRELLWLEIAWVKNFQEWVLGLASFPSVDALQGLFAPHDSSSRLVSMHNCLPQQHAEHWGYTTVVHNSVCQCLWEEAVLWCSGTNLSIPLRGLAGPMNSALWEEYCHCVAPHVNLSRYSERTLWCCTNTGVACLKPHACCLTGKS